MSHCPKELLAEAAGLAGASREQGLARVDALIADYAADGRLHFLRGSLLAALKDYAGARQAMAAAVQLAPGFPLARFQLGLLDLTSGNPASAEAVWAPLLTLPAEHPLRLFVQGLQRMIADDFGAAIALLEQGVARNTDNAPLNADMAMLVREMAGRAGEEPTAGVQPAVEAAKVEEGEEVTSSAQMLLKQSRKGPTKH